jgi:hypothetical protein
MMLAPTTIVLAVSPSLNAEGRKAYSTRGQLFDGTVDGRSIVKRSTTPFCDAARALLAEGVDPATRLVMRHASSVADALRSTVGVAAGLTGADDNGGKPVFRKWSPYDRGETLPVAPPMRQTAPPLVQVPSAPARVLPDLSRRFAEEALLREIEAPPTPPSPAAQGNQEPTGP